MLSLLNLENIAVIERAEIAFAQGLHVLTGETGAGKSIIVGALGAVTGARVSRDMVRSGASTGRITALFTGLSGPLRRQLEQMGWDTQEDQLHIQREISADGRSVCRINFRPATAAALRQLGPYLLDIYGQHDGQKLLQEENHLTLLDQFAGLQEMAGQCRRAYADVVALRRQLKQCQAREEQRQARTELLTAQLSEIEQAELVPGEEEQLAQKKKTMEESGRIARALTAAADCLAGTGEEPGAMELLEECAGQLGSLAEVSEEMRNLGERAAELTVLAQELHADVRDRLEGLDFPPQDRRALEERLNLLYDLKQKYGPDLPAVLAYAERARQELEQWEQSDGQLRQLQQEYQQRWEELKHLARELSQRRGDGAGRLQRRLEEQLRQLDMPNAVFRIAVEQTGVLGAAGMDRVSFLFSANPGQEVKPLAKIASGGELSRVMLALKNVLAETETVDTMVFDEIDAGVSGHAAQRIAEKLSQVAAGGRQVLCITHLPQISAMADEHYAIEKIQGKTSTNTRVRLLSPEEREREVARLISGQEITAAALQNARELIDQANQYKRKHRGGDQ